MAKVDQKWIRGPADVLAVEQGCWFDEEAGLRVIRFVETFCCQSKGKWGGEPLELLDWQKDLVMRLFGWKTAEGLRRYKRLYCEVAKKNGKSTLVSALTIVFMLLDGEAGPEIYLNACDKQQAEIVYDEAARMVRKSPELAKRLRPIDSKKRIVWAAGNGVIRANSAEVATKDGLNPSLTVFDELHRQKDRELWGVFEFAGVAREQPMLISITTAGESEDGVWFQQREYSEGVNAGTIPDITHLGVVYRALPTDDYESPDTWVKANPSLGHTIKFEDFKRDLEEAKQTPEQWANFLRLRLNIVARAAGKFLGPDEWKACDSPATTLADFREQSCVAGLDLGSKYDLTALVLIFGNHNDGFVIWCRLYMPGDTVLEASRRDQVPYDAWIRAGWVKETEGAATDYEVIRQDILEARDEFGIEIQLINMDGWNSTYLANRLGDDGFNLAEVRQGYGSLNAPTKELRRLVRLRKIGNGSNPVLRWCVLNAVAASDPAENIKLDKKLSRQRIDAAAALVNAVAGLPEAGDETSVYESRGVEWL